MLLNTGNSIVQSTHGMLACYCQRVRSSLPLRRSVDNRRLPAWPQRACQLRARGLSFAAANDDLRACANRRARLPWLALASAGSRTTWRSFDSRPTWVRAHHIQHTRSLQWLHCFLSCCTWTARIMAGKRRRDGAWRGGQWRCLLRARILRPALAVLARRRSRVRVSRLLFMALIC